MISRRTFLKALAAIPAIAAVSPPVLAALPEEDGPEIAPWLSIAGVMVELRDMSLVTNVDQARYVGSDGNTAVFHGVARCSLEALVSFDHALLGAFFVNERVPIEARFAYGEAVRATAIITNVVVNNETKLDSATMHISAELFEVDLGTEP